MDLKTIQEYYPRYTTFIGFYATDESFEASCFKDVKNIDRWEYAPLNWSNGYLPFVRYVGNNTFECWMFSYLPVRGYYTENGEDFKLVTYFEDFNYEVIDPFIEDEDNIILKPDIDTYGSFEEASKYENMVETAARLFDEKAYKEGRILTSYDAIKRFCSKMEENK